MVVFSLRWRMDYISDPVLRITYVGKYRYHIVIKDGSRWIDEEIDRGELMDSLRNERLVEFTAGDVVYFLDNGEVGFKLEVLLEPMRGNVTQIPLSILPA
jgi:hypothetical protein